MSQIRKLNENEIDRFIDLFSDAYPAFMVKNEEERKKYREIFIKADKDPRYSMYGLLREDEILGVMRFFDFQMNFHNKKILAGGLGAVAVDLLHKKEHVAKEMVEFYLDHYKKLGASMTILWAFRHDFYKAMGWGYGTKIYVYKVKPEHLPRTNKKHIRYLTLDDTEILNDCYNRYVEKTHGMIEESSYTRKLRIERNKTFKCIGCVKNNKVEGYMILSFTKADGDSFIENDMVVEEMIYENPEALSEMMTYLHIQFDQINRVIFRTSDEYFYTMLKDPRNGTMNMIPSVYHESSIMGAGMMYRIIDTDGLFVQMADHNFNNQTIKLKFNVADSFYPSNAGSIILHFENGTLSTDNDGSYEVEVDIDVSELSSLVMGAVNFKSLYDFSLIKISDISFVEVLNKLFYVEEKPVCMTGF